MRIWSAALLLATLLMHGCAELTTTVTAAPPPQNPTAGDACLAEIVNWLKTDTIPWVATKASRNPNLKNRAFTVVVWDTERDDVATTISELEREIRSAIEGDIMATCGGCDYIRMTPPKAFSQWHHDSLVKVQCQSSRSIDWYLKISTRKNKLTNKLVIQIGGAEPDGAVFRNIPDLGRSAEFCLSPQVEQLMSAMSQDEFLRGTRHLPFESSQSDLVADYLAHRVSCIFQSMSKGQELSVFLDSSRISADTFAGSVFGIIQMQVDKFNEIKIVNEMAKADVVMYPKVYELSGDVSQVWLTVDRTARSQPPEGKSKIGVSTQAYVKKK